MRSIIAGGLASVVALAACDQIAGIELARTGWTGGTSSEGSGASVTTTSAGTSSEGSGASGTTTSGSSSSTSGMGCTIDGAQDGTKTDVDCGGAACDAQGHACAFGKKCLVNADCATGFCNGATCDAQTIGPGPVAAIAVDATSVYWAGGHSIMKAPVGGGATITLAAASAPNDIAIDATYVYWTGSGWAVNAVPLAGGTSMTLGTLPSQSTPSGIVVDGTTIYVALLGDVMGQVMDMPITGGTATTLAQDMYSPGKLAQDTLNIYWHNTEGEVYAVPKGGGARMLLMSSLGVPNVAVDATSVYSASSITGDIVKVPKAGGATSTLAFNQNQPIAVAVDEANVYWANAGDGTVMRVSTGGGTPMLLASGQGTSLTCIALDATSVYWGSSGATGVVKKVLK